MSDYLKLAHAMQSGIAMEMELGQLYTTPKHLRVGVNSALVNQAGLAALLIAKGVITEAEYEAAIVNEMANEVKRYEERLSAHFGNKITLG